MYTIFIRPSALTVKLVAAGCALLCAALLANRLLQANSREAAASLTAADAEIPCMLHQSWNDSRLPSARARRWRASWLNCLPNCQHLLWTDADNRLLIGLHYQWLLPVYECQKTPRAKAELARYVYMLHYGGVYADLDTVCLRDFRPLLRPWALAFAGMEATAAAGRRSGLSTGEDSLNGSYVQSSFLASRRGHPFWLRLLRRIVQSHRSGEAKRLSDSKGSISPVLMEELSAYLRNGSAPDARVFEPRYFNPFSWMTGSNGKGRQSSESGCKLRGAMTEDEEAACLASFPGAYVVQMHSNVWSGGRI